MILCDIGNTHATFLENSKIKKIDIKNFKNYEAKQKIYYICVNDEIKNYLRNKNYFFDLEPFFEIETIYKGLGIDRVAACSTIKNGVIVDAGSAITIDIMANNIHLGGLILPGINNYLLMYKKISPRLDVILNTQIDLQSLPQTTIDAISYGIIKPIINILPEIAVDKKIYFTGGDGEFLSKFYKDSIYDKTLIFRSMQKLIKEKNL